MAELLVSVRSPEEGILALEGGAGLIDVKEPARGPLGRAGDAVIESVVDAVGGRCPVSAALGEWVDRLPAPKCKGLTFVKYGLAGAAGNHWQTAHTTLDQRKPQLVVVAYADAACAEAPPVDEVVEFACRRPGNVLLIDTCCKDAGRSNLRRRPTLLDWLGIAEIVSICARCRDAGVRVALAGSLGVAEIEALLPARPNWFAVRGAVCEGGERGATLSWERVEHLANLARTAEPNSFQLSFPRTDPIHEIGTAEIEDPNMQ